MEPQTGFEPAFSFQLPWSRFVAERDTEALNLERIVRLKLTSLAWKAKAQSLYHTRIKLIYTKRNSPRCSVLLFAQWGFTGSTLSLSYANKPQYIGDLEGL